MAIEYVTVPLLVASAVSVAAIVTVYARAASGVPETAPAVAFSVSPPGSAPDTIDHVTDPLPPDACCVALYATVARPAGSDGVPIATGGAAGTLDFRATRNTSCRAPAPGSPLRSVPSVFSQLEGKSTQWPSGETFGRGMYQNAVAVASRSLVTSLRWCAKRHTVGSAPAAASVCTAMISSSHARNGVVFVPCR